MSALIVVAMTSRGLPLAEGGPGGSGVALSFLCGIALLAVGISLLAGISESSRYVRRP